MPTYPTRRAALAGCLAALAASAAPLAALAQDVSGTYRAEGMNPNGSRYEGVVQIQQSGDAIALAWEVAGRTYTGTGDLTARVATVNWGDTSPVVYVVMPSGEWHGTWANGTALEKLIPQ